MRTENEKKIIGLLGVGFDASDGHIRITKGEKYDVYMGSEESHEYIIGLIKKIESELDHRGLILTELNQNELSLIINKVI